MRFRYTSSDPKDFPDELLYLMRDCHNICKCIHLPAQTRSTTVLKCRGYCRETILSLFKRYAESFQMLESAVILYVVKRDRKIGIAPSVILWAKLILILEACFVKVGA